MTTETLEPSKLDIEQQFGERDDAGKTFMVSIPSHLLFSLVGPAPDMVDRRQAFDLWLDAMNPTIRSGIPVELARAVEGPRAAGDDTRLIELMRLCGGRGTKRYSRDGERLVVTGSDLQRFLAAALSNGVAS